MPRSPAKALASTVASAADTEIPTGAGTPEPADGAGALQMSIGLTPGPVRPAACATPSSASLSARDRRLMRASSRRAAVRSGIGIACASSTGSRLAV
jgi:hypothetical protein